MTTPRWYMVNKMGMATLCASKADAEQEAADAQRFWSHMGPHRAVQLVEAASVAASAGSEPVAEVMFADGKKYIQYTMPKELLPVGTKLYSHPSPPEGMVGGWMPIETAPKDGARILLHPAVEVHDAWSKGHWSEQQKCWIVGGSASGVTHTHWMPLPLPPTNPAGSGKGE